MTLPDLIAEWDVCYQTRIGCLCGIADPTPEQKQIASDESDAHVAALRGWTPEPLSLAHQTKTSVNPK